MLFARTASGFSLQGLGDLPGGDSYSAAWGISGDGSTIVGDSGSPNGSEAFFWKSSRGMTGVGALPNRPFFSIGRGTSQDGSVVVGYSSNSSGALEAFRWSSADGMVDLGSLSGGGYSEALAASSNGNVVVGVGSSSSASFEAYQWTSSSGMVGLGFLSGDSGSYAFGVSGEGSVVIGASYGSARSQAYRWTNATGMVGLGFLDGGSKRSVALGISTDGSTIVGSSDSTQGKQAFRWTRSLGMVGLGYLPGRSFDSESLAVSADGSVVVGESRSNEGSEAFVWSSQTGMLSVRDILTNKGVDLTGWKLQSATAVSADGTVIAGNGTHNGTNEAWVANLSTASDQGKTHAIYKSVAYQTLIGNNQITTLVSRGYFVYDPETQRGTAVAGFVVNHSKVFSVVPLQNIRVEHVTGMHGTTYTIIAKAESPGTQFAGTLLESAYMRGQDSYVVIDATGPRKLPRTFVSSGRSITQNTETGTTIAGEVSGSFVLDVNGSRSSNLSETFDAAVSRLTNLFVARGYVQFTPVPAQ